MFAMPPEYDHYLPPTRAAVEAEIERLDALWEVS